MSKVSYSLIDDDHIDDQETINVGNLIIDLESVLEKEKIENEQQANNTNNNANSQSVSTPAKTCTTTIFNNNNKSQQPPSSTTTTTSIETKPSSSTNNKNSSNNIKLNSNQKNYSADKLSNSSNTNNNNNSINMNNNSNCNNNNDGALTTKSVYKSGGEIKMRIARETKAGKSEHKIVSSPNQKSPTSSGIVTVSSHNNYNNIAPGTTSVGLNNNNSSNHNNHHKTNSEDNILEPTQSSSSISSTKECGTSTSIGTITEPECLGPCEPGTSVTLEGIVWQETEGGILVVNVTWRGKTYVGALLDCTKHDWAPPRLCDSPASDIDSKAHKGVRTKRIVTRSNGIGLDEKNLLQTTGKLRNGKGRRILTANDLAPCNKRQRESDKTIENITVPAEAKTSSGNVSSITNSDNACVPVSIDTTPTNNNENISTTDTLSNKTGPNSPMLIGCGEPNCSKKYRNMNGLLYHQAHAHGNNNDNSSNAKDKIESPTESTDSVDNEEKPSDVIEVPEQDTRRCEISNEQNSNNVKQEFDEHLREKPININAPNIETSYKSSTLNVPVTTTTLTTPTAPMPIPTMETNNTNSIINQPMEQSSSIIRFHESEKRSSSSTHDIMNNSHLHRKSPVVDNCNSNVPKPKQQANNNPPPLSTIMEEGMKPSGTSTGPPPAPHQANCFFNSPFMAGVPYNPFSMNPYLARPPTLPPPMYDQLTQPTTSNAIFKLMNSMRVPPLPESPSRLLSPSVPKSLPFPPYKVEPGPHVPTSSPMTNPPMPNMPPMMNSHIGGGSPHPRMPGQIDPMLPPGLPPFPPPPILNVPPTSINPLSRPPVPNLLDDPLSKQYPRRFN